MKKNSYGLLLVPEFSANGLCRHQGNEYKSTIQNIGSSEHFPVQGFFFFHFKYPMFPCNTTISFLCFGIQNQTFVMVQTA